MWFKGYEKIKKIIFKKKCNIEPNAKAAFGEKVREPWGKSK